MTSVESPFVVVRIATPGPRVQEIIELVGCEPTVVFPSVSRGGVAWRRPRHAPTDKDVLSFSFDSDDDNLDERISHAGGLLKNLARFSPIEELEVVVTVVRAPESDPPVELPAGFLADVAACEGLLLV